MTSKAVCAFFAWMSLLAMGLTLSAAEKIGWLSHVVEDAEFRIRPILDRDEIQALIGDDLDGEFIFLEVEIQPLYNAKVDIDRDDFLLRSRRDNDRSTAMSPDQIAGESVVVVSSAKRAGGGVFGESYDPVFGPAGGPASDSGTFGSGGGATSETTTRSERQGVSSLYERLSQIELPVGPTREPKKGYLYFQISPKNKAKHLHFFYDGPVGEFSIPFLPEK